MPLPGARALAAGAGAAVAASAASFAAYWHVTYGPEALPRMLTAYSVTVPCFLQYRYTQLVHEHLPERLGLTVDRERARARYQALHAHYAPAVFATFLGLRGFYIKTGQLIGTNLANAAPLHWQRVFEPFLDAVPPKPFAYVRATVEAELGAPLEALYSAFDPQPLASASIGQVHRATLRASGARVVVKVMYPEVEARFRGDVTSAKAFVAWALPEHLPPLTEIEKQFANEFDYRREAAQLARVRANLAAGGFAVIVPEPVLALCSKRVLTMSEVPRCEKLAVALRRDVEAAAAAAGRPLAELEAEERAASEAALARGELRCGLSAGALDALIAAAQWRNWWGGWVGAQPVHVPVNHARLIDELLEVHGHEVLVDGAFNGDPHPGNCLISYGVGDSGGDSGGGGRGRGRAPRLALVDYGQVKELSTEARLKFARLICALARAQPGNAAHRRAVAAEMLACGMRTRHCNPDVMYEYALLYFDRDDKLATRGKHIQAYLDTLEAVDPQGSTSEDYVMVARCSLMLRGLGHILNQHRSAAKAWAPIAERVLREAGQEYVPIED